MRSFSPALPLRGWSPSTPWSSWIHRRPSWWEWLQRSHCPSPTDTQKIRHLQSSFKTKPKGKRQVIKSFISNFRTSTRSTYRSLYWSKALLASTSSFLRRTEGIAPSSIGGSYLLLHGDLKDKDRQQSVDSHMKTYISRSVIDWQELHWLTLDETSGWSSKSTGLMQNLCWSEVCKLQSIKHSLHFVFYIAYK